MRPELSKHTEEMLHIGRRLVKESPFLVSEVGTTNTKGDQTIEMDIALENAFLEYLKESNLPVLAYSEEVGLVELHDDPKYLVAFDPLDGSTNYKLGRGILPFGSLITFYRGTDPYLKDIVAAGAIEYTTDRLYLFSDGQTTDEKGNRILLKTDWEISKKTPLYLETYDEGYEFYRPVTHKFGIKNQGALVSSLVYTLNNSTPAMGGIAVKSEEVGAIYALVEGAGGIVTDNFGRSIAGEKLDHDRKYSLLAGNKTIVEVVVASLK